VVVPDSDQDRAFEFYDGVHGFEKRLDFAYESGERWVEVVPPGAGTSLNLAASPEAGVETGVILLSADVHADRAELARAGVEVSELLPEGVVRYWAGTPLAGRPPMFLLSDLDGNSFAIVSATA
jgi:hypothetical protein